MSQDSDGSVTQNILSSMAAPSIGEPFNFSKILDCTLCPRVVNHDPNITAGAKLMWGVIRMFTHNEEGVCFASDQQLADEIAVSDRQLRNYCRELRKAGLLRETERAGRTTLRELLFEKRFLARVRRPGAPNPTLINSPSVRLPLDRKGVEIDFHPPRKSSSRGVEIDFQGHPYIGRLKDKEPNVASSPLDVDRPVEEPHSKGDDDDERTTTGGAADRLTAAAPECIPAHTPRPEPKPSPQSANTSGITADIRPIEQLVKYLRFQFMTIMEAKLKALQKAGMNSEEIQALSPRLNPPAEFFIALARILQIRKVDYIGYCLTMSYIVKNLKEPPGFGIWMNTATGWAPSPSAEELSKPE